MRTRLVAPYRRIADVVTEAFWLLLNHKWPDDILVAEDVAPLTWLLEAERVTSVFSENPDLPE